MSTFSNVVTRTSIVVICLSFAGVTEAADDYWTGAVDAYWSHSGNWSTGATPGSSYVVRFDNLATANLNTIACAPGDLNCDGNVDAGDYVYWRKTNGSAADYTAFRANFGNTGGPSVLGIVSTSTSNVGPSGPVTISGKPITVGSTGILLGQNASQSPAYPGPAQQDLTINADLALSADQTWQTGGTAGRILTIGASPANTIALNGFKPTIRALSSNTLMTIVNSSLVDGSAPSSVAYSKTAANESFSPTSGVNNNAMMRIRIAGNSTYSGGTTIRGGRQVLQIGNSSVTNGSTIVSGPFGTGTIDILHEFSTTSNNNQNPLMQAFGADRTIDNPMIIEDKAVNDSNTTLVIPNNNIQFTSTKDDTENSATAHRKLTFNGLVTIKGEAQFALNGLIQANASPASNRDGCGDVVFNGDVQLSGGASPPSGSSWRFQVGQGNDGVTAGVVIGKMVFNGNILQTGAGSYSLTNANGTTGSPSIVQFYGQNTYTGGLTLTAPDASSPTANANLGLGSNSTLSGSTIISGPLGTGTLSIGSATTGSTSSVEALGGARTVANPINLTLLQSNLVVRGSNDLTLNGAISGFGGATMNGTGKLTLGGADSYGGATAVNSGTLLVNGSLSTSGVTVASGATLGGTGGITTASPITNNGTIAPGASVGSLNVTGDVTDQGTSSWAIELSGTSSDLLVVTGNITLSGTDTVSVTGAGTGASWIIATYTGSLTGTFGGVTSGYSLDYGTLGQIILRTPGSGAGGGLSQAAVPEPGTILLGLFAVGLATVFRRRRVR
jgi:autotransporter-associated beta strand protein